MMGKTREPFVGETITTPRGKGVVIGVTKWSGLTPAIQSRSMDALRAQLGNTFTHTYFQVHVEFKNSDMAQFHCWEVDYDTERDPEDAPWREPRPDIESGD
jgi:hypothetical protein